MESQNKTTIYTIIYNLNLRSQNKVKKLDIITNESLEDCMNDMTLNYIKYNDFFESITKVSDKNPNSILSNNNMIATKQNILQNQN